MLRVEVRLKGGRSYPVEVGAGSLSSLGAVARAHLAQEARRVALVSNRRVFELYGARAVASLSGAGFRVVRWMMGDGERFKTLRTAERALGFLSESRLERGDAVVALGGGVVGDLAGFAAAVYLRGIAFVQVPTTLLAQIDSSVGGKTGVNTSAGKNLAGAFHQPSLVLIDTETLRTLPPRELTAGWCEAVKQGAVASRKLFDQTVDFLSRGGEPDELIAAQCRFKASIVARDEREEIARTNRRSRRILNFGHTTAHALEKVTGYRRFRHGEAVGRGMLVAGEISNNLGMLAPRELESLREAVRLCGPLPPAQDIDVDEVMRLIKSDKKSVSGKIK